MSTTLTIKCGLCREKFPWPKDTKFPDYCACCGKYIGHGRDDDDIVMPFIRTNGKSASVDKVYRDMEAGSEFRAQMAAEQAGVPVSEMAGLKITNLNDRRDAEIAAPALTGSAAELERVIHAQASPIPVGFQGGAPQYVNGGAPGATAGIRRSVAFSHQEMAVRNGLPAPPSYDISSVQPKKAQ